MITIDLQDDEITREKTPPRRGKEVRRKGGRHLDLTTTTGEKAENRLTKPGLIARFLNKIFKES